MDLLRAQAGLIPFWVLGLQLCITMPCSRNNYVAILLYCSNYWTILLQIFLDSEEYFLFIFLIMYLCQERLTIGLDYNSSGRSMRHSNVLLPSSPALHSCSASLSILKLSVDWTGRRLRYETVGACLTLYVQCWAWWFFFLMRMKSSDPWYWPSLAPGLLGKLDLLWAEAVFYFNDKLPETPTGLQRVSSQLSMTFHNSAHTHGCSYTAPSGTAGFTPWRTSVGDAFCSSASPTAPNVEILTLLKGRGFFF